MSDKKLKDFKKKIEQFVASKTPFLFLIDFEMEKPFVCRITDAKKNNIYFEINGNKNYSLSKPDIQLKKFKKHPITKKKYFSAFNKTQKHLKRGDSYLVNLTFKSRIETNLTLHEIFNLSAAKYKLFFKDKFALFSPECFIRINDNQIFSYPMKGTIDADLPNAKKKILENKKELFEHNTIVDLIRNDISIVAKNVQVTKFRYIEKVITNQKNLLQVSSEIKGELTENWQQDLGEILIKMLPAGSISGAPKQKTLEIIREAEKEKRGYYTGIFGIFDGNNLDSAVNIRYIEKINNKLYFRSGGGITVLSNPDTEYNELIDKIYVPFS